ncbi:N-acetylmuramoyl-L-alanine amidase [Paenibacillus chartarius]|uniref:N-acetylmuramoyl-L-alanine amidase n=1 Tax=Paenibacillus chartarius TaxID=747481 RepID=A0ABV6DMM3_9BACL
MAIKRSRKNRSILGMLAIMAASAILPAQPAAAKAAGEQIVCVDPGHQLRGNHETEPVSPHSTTMKAKVSSGTTGVKTKKPEYVLTLEASLLLKEKLKSFGYTVVMTRETHDVDISNVERAQRCNEAGADLAVRIHADGDSSSRTQGISLLYPAWSEAAQTIYAPSKAAAEMILADTAAATGAVSRGIVPRSDLTGFNWSTVPTVLVEMGFMTNPNEDLKLSDPEYMNRLTEGMALGITKALAVQVGEQEAEQRFSVDLAGQTTLHHYANGRMYRTRLALAPQTVQVTATRGNWGKIETWIGPMWVYVGGLQQKQ